MGDGFLVEFVSVVEAMACAVELQKLLEEMPIKIDEGLSLKLRIGLHLGDVLAEDGDLYGDGVNVAARLEGIAPIGGIACSDVVCSQVSKRLPLTFLDQGPKILKNIESPIRVHFVGQATTVVKREALRATSKKVSIALLPFVDSGAKVDDYFAEGVSEDILTELSRFRDLVVISRNSSFVFKGQTRDLAEIAGILGVDYIVTGSIRRSGDRVRIAAQLTYVSSKEEVWSDKYDRLLEDLFALQDDIVRTLVVTLVSRLNLSMAQRLQARPLPNLEAYECLLLARKLVGEHDAETAMPFVEQALALDPSYALAHCMLAGVHYVRWLKNPTADNISAMEAAARRAVELDPTDAKNPAILGMALCCNAQLVSAGAYLRRAMELNPFDSFAMPYYAEWLWRVGDGNRALEVMDDVLRRDPIPPTWYWEIRGLILTLLQRYADALDAFSRQTKQFWYVKGYKAVCNAHLGDLDAARSELREMLRDHPDKSSARRILVNETESIEYRRLLDDGLTLAGLEQI
jgi:TolB-like protein